MPSVSAGRRLRRPLPFRGRVIVSWVAVVAWIAIVLGLGGDGFSTDSTSRILHPLLEWLFASAPPESLDILHWLIRKGAHAFEYGVLALLTLRALTVTRTVPATRGIWLAIGFVLMVAVADEGRQVFSRERQGAWTDVLLDLTGAGASLGAVQVLPGSARRKLTGGGSPRRVGAGW